MTVLDPHPAPEPDGPVPTVEGPGVTEASPAPLTQWQLARRRFLRHKLAVAGLIVLVALGLACSTAALWAPYAQNHQDLSLGPVAPSAEHWMGTDQLGRDQFSEILYAGQISMRIALAVALLSTAVGGVIGAVAGFYGRWVDQLLMRVTDLFLVVPSIAVLAIALQRFGRSANVITVVLAGLGWMVMARIVRSQVLSLKEKEFVEAARAAGATGPRIIFRHILPNCLGAIVVNATLTVGAAVVTESTLSYLGFGVQKPQLSWGNMLSDAQGNFDNNTHLIYFPGLMILLVVLCVNFLGDGLRDAFDPQAAR